MTTPDGRLRVLWLAKGLGPGGMERLLVHHARFGDRERFDYVAAHVVDRPNSVVPELEALGVRCHRLGPPGGSGARPDWVGDLRRLLRDERIDLVHSHSPLPASMARPLVRSVRPRPRHVYTEHNTWDCYGRATRTANLLTYRLDDHQFAVSAEAAGSAPGFLHRRPEVLTHGVDLDALRAVPVERDEVRAELGLEPGTPLVVTVANLRREKAYDVLLEASRRLGEAHPGAVVLSVGHGPLDGELRALQDRLGLGDRFRFLGFRSDVVRLLAAADVFTLSSRQEGLPVAFMEAMAVGCPAVVTSVGGLPAHVDGTNGLLVPPERPDLLAEALGRVVGDPALRHDLAAGARRHADRFDARVAIRRQEAVYEELAG